MWEPTGLGSTLSRLAPALLDDAADRLFNEARSFRRFGRRQRHRVRILAKRLRYALDLFAATLPAHDTVEYIDRLAEFQESLGELTDAYAALELLRERLDKAETVKVLSEWVEAIEPGLVDRAARQLSAIARRPRPCRPSSSPRSSRA